MEDDSQLGRKLAIVTSIFLFIGLWVLISGIITYNQAAESVNWPTTSGTIIYSNIYEEHDIDDGYITYYLEIEYEYEVNGVVYVGDKFTVDSSRKAYSSYSEAQSELNSYPIGLRVRVHYDPNKPSNCVLNPGVKPSDYITLFIGIIFTIVGGILTFGALLSDQKPNSIISKSKDYPRSEHSSSKTIDESINNLSIQKCENCGISNSTHQNFCENCGLRLKD